MTDQDIYCLIDRYCKKNGIFILNNTIIYDINNLTKTHGTELLMLIIHDNTLYRLTIKSNPQEVYHTNDIYKFIPLSELIRQERLEKLSILLENE
jgi:hypothetical protein